MRTFRAALLALLLLPIGPAVARSAPPPSGDTAARDAVIAELMDLSGMDATLRQLPGLIEAELDRPPDPDLDEATYAMLRVVLLGTFQAEALRRGVMEELAAGYEPERFAAFRELLNRPLLKRMTALEVAAGTPEAQAEMDRDEAALLAGAGPERLALVDRLDAASGATRMGTDLALMPVETMGTIHFPLLPEAERARQREALDETLEQLRPEIEASMRHAVVVSYVYTYRDVDDADFAAYVEMVESDLARDWMRRTADAFRHAVARAQAHAAAELMRRLVGGTEI